MWGGGLPGGCTRLAYLLRSGGDLLDAGHGCLLLDDLREFCNL